MAITVFERNERSDIIRNLESSEKIHERKRKEVSSRKGEKKLKEREREKLRKSKGKRRAGGRVPEVD